VHVLRVERIEEPIYRPAPFAHFTGVEQVRRAILLEILSGALRPGERLLEARISKDLGVSQATVNAALQDLHDQGMVTKLLNRSPRSALHAGGHQKALQGANAVGTGGNGSGIRRLF
jgi:Bacterial regulatory proteins, gntR family